MTQQSYYIETFGCQMNDRDSEIMAQLLSRHYSPALSIDDADVVVVNTCSIRAKAEQKAFSLLGRLRRNKERNKDLLVAVAGCVAQQDGEAILERLPHVDLVIGTQNIYNLPALLAEAGLQGRRLAAVEQTSTFEIPPYLPDADGGLGHRRFVTIMQGCNNFCSYCVVPHTRGREISRPLAHVMDEVDHLVAHGVREITLLGQNVNSYLGADGEKKCDFAGLLRRVAATGVKRLRFTTSNPHDLSPEIIACFADLPNLCSHFHLPVQSGSDRVLKAMHRRYTRAAYLDLVADLRAARPDIAITTDIIVGFPGESEEDFKMTCSLIEEVRYHGAFSFRYSDRPNTRSSGFPGKLPEEEKQRRLADLQDRIERIAAERLEEYVGNGLEVMVEGRSRSGQWSGRSSQNIIVNFEHPGEPRPGSLCNVHVTEACRHSLRGVPAATQGSRL